MAKTETIQISIRKCEKCNEEFLAIGKNRICPKCKIKMKPKPKICVRCGKEFRSKSQFCSECLAIMKPKPKTKVCLWCHSQFISSKPNHKFCCFECQQAFNAVKEKIGKNTENINDFIAECAKLEALGKNYKLFKRPLCEEESEIEE